MDTLDAKKLVQETLESAFDKDRFARLVKNVVEYDGSHPRRAQGGRIRAKFQKYICVCERIGVYKEPKSKKMMDILIVHLQKNTSLEHARTALRNFVADHLYNTPEKKEAALVAFVAPNKKDWRFSLVRMEYKIVRSRIREDLSPARRYSFLVGKNEKSHTAQSRLLPLLTGDGKPTLAAMEDAFSIEAVTDEFFERYRDLLHNLMDALEVIKKTDEEVREDFAARDISTPDFAKKLLGQIVFLYFLQKKGWFGVAKGKKWGEGSKHFLRELFEKKHGGYQNFFNDIMEPLFYEALRHQRDDDYYSRFKCRIPFLNGGLFDPLNDYGWIDTDILLPNDLFSNKNPTPQGDVGDGILDIFDRYNFTVKEDEPLEKEVAVDPEMLGKIFERSLEVTNRKVTGTYYTPREIVHYMCQESLIHHLVTAPESKVDKEDLTTLVRYGETYIEHDSRVASKGARTKNGYKMPLNVIQHAKGIDKSLADIRVCDPAVGSGAFPVGMMNEIIRVRAALTPYLGKRDKRSTHDFKRHAIQSCLYGVDKSPGAVEICKLRLWLSLLVDEDNRQDIHPLPNLDYKIMQGDSLLGACKSDHNGAPDIFHEEEMQNLYELKQLFFNETAPRKKRGHREQIDDLIGKMTDGHKDFNFGAYFSEVFHEKSGFDVVIANPPYVEHKKLKGISSLLKKFRVYSGTADLYVYFYEAALGILRKGGVVSFISSNKFIRAKYGAPLRLLLSKNKIHNIVDFGDTKIFDALVASCIILASKKEPPIEVLVTFADDTFSDNLADYIANNHIKVPDNSLGNEIWQLGDKTKLGLKLKIEAGTKKLGTTNGINIFRGVTTGFNPAFIINEEKREELIGPDASNEDIIKPLLQGRNIRKWYYQTTRKYLLFLPWHFPLHHSQNISGASVKAEKSFKSDYPDIYRHICQFKGELTKRNKEETGIRYEWYALQRCAASYYPEFKKDKIIWGLTADKWAFAYDSKGHYLPSNGYILTSSSLAVKYLLALLNSKLMQFYFSFVGIMTAGGAYTLKYETMADFPVHDLSQSEQKPFVALANKILAITQSKDYPNNETKQAKVREYEREIDGLVYALYGLTKAEIEIVEKATKTV